MMNVPLVRINNNHLHLGPEHCLKYWLLSVVFSHKATGGKKSSQNGYTEEESHHTQADSPNG